MAFDNVRRKKGDANSDSLVGNWETVNYDYKIKSDNSELYLASERIESFSLNDSGHLTAVDDETQYNEDGSVSGTPSGTQYSLYSFDGTNYTETGCPDNTFTGCSGGDSKPAFVDGELFVEEDNVYTRD